MKEEWRAVVGHEGQYEVSDLGRVRSLARFIKITRLLRNGYVGSYLRLFPTKIMDGGLTDGHRTVRIDRETYMVRTLVLEAFVGPRPKGDFWGTNLDGDRSNNAATNVAWLSFVDVNRRRVAAVRARRAAA